MGTSVVCLSVLGTVPHLNQEVQQMCPAVYHPIIGRPMNPPTTILGTLVLFALAEKPGSALEIKQIVAGRMGGRDPSDGAFFAALKKGCVGGFIEKSTTPGTPTYTLTRTGRAVALSLYRQLSGWPALDM